MSLPSQRRPVALVTGAGTGIGKMIVGGIEDLERRAAESEAA